MLKKSYSRPKGITLMELLVAALILALLSIIILQAVTYSYLLNVANRNLIIATTHAQYVMEDIKSKNINASGFDSIISGINSGNWNSNPGNWNWNGMSPSPSLLINESITACCVTSPTDTTCTSCSLGSNLLNVIVTVTWVDKLNRPRNTSLQTCFAKP